MELEKKEDGRHQITVSDSGCVGDNGQTEKHHDGETYHNETLRCLLHGLVEVDMLVDAYISHSETLRCILHAFVRLFSFSLAFFSDLKRCL